MSENKQFLDDIEIVSKYFNKKINEDCLKLSLTKLFDHLKHKVESQSSLIVKIRKKRKISRTAVWQKTS